MDRGDSRGSQDGSKPGKETIEAPAVQRRGRVGRYELRGLLGSGSSKEVYLARDERLDRDVALALLVGASVGEQARARVRLEMQVTGRLGDHPHIITVYDAGDADGTPYLVLRYMAGGSLMQRIADARGGLELDETIALGCQIADGLAHAHAHGIVHRDVKPDNVWLAADGSAALGDFGIAFAGDRPRLTGEGLMLGTAHYLSPEQARGRDVGPASDLYALGVTLYELACGRPPFEGDDSVAVVAQHLREPPPPPSTWVPGIPEPLERMILSLLAKTPGDRPPSAGAVRDALAGLAGRTAPTAGARVRSGRGAFVGREEVMASLRAAAVAATAPGACRVAVLLGEPGVGKSRCARELAAQTGTLGAEGLWAACAEDEGAPVYWPWIQLLRRMRGSGSSPGAHDLHHLVGAPEPPATTSPEEARFRFFDAVARRVEAAATERPLVAVLDDVQWADRSSLQLLVHVVRSVRDARLLIVLTAHESAARHSEPLRRVLAELAREAGFLRLELGGLASNEVALLLQLTTGLVPGADLAAEVRRRTGGNAFFVGEVARTLAGAQDLTAALSAVPSGVRESVSRRVTQLSAETVDALETAAVIGRQFTLPLLASAAKVDRAAAVEALDVAVRKQLLTTTGVAGRYAFTHAIVHDVIYRELSAGERARRHAAVGAALEDRRRRALSDGVAELAYHWLAAARGGQDAEPALRFAVEAAETAAAGLAHAEAAAHYEHALEAAELAELDDDARRGQLLLAMAQASTAAGDLAEGQRRYGEAATVAQRSGDAALLARAALGYAEWQLYGVVNDTAITLLEQTLAAMPERDDPLRASLLGRLAVCLDPHRDQARREQLLGEAIAMARRLGDVTPLSRLLALSPLIHWHPEQAERRRADAAETITLARTGGDPEGALWAHMIRYVEAFGLGDVTDADRELDAFAGIAADMHQPYYRWYETVLRAGRAVFTGRFDDGMRLAREAVVVNREHEPDSEQEYTVQVLVLALARGEPHEANLEQLRAFADRYSKLPMWSALTALLECELGESPAARERFERLATGDFGAIVRDPDRVTTLALLGELAATLGDAKRAGQLYELLVPYERRNVLVERGWAALGAAARPLGRLAAATGDTSRAAGHFERALELELAWDARPWLLRTISNYADAVPDAPGTSQRLAEGRRLAAALGAQRLAQRFQLLVELHAPTKTNGAQ